MLEIRAATHMPPEALIGWLTQPKASWDYRWMATNSSVYNTEKWINNHRRSSVNLTVSKKVLRFNAGLQSFLRGCSRARILSRTAPRLHYLSGGKNKNVKVKRTSKAVTNPTSRAMSECMSNPCTKAASQKKKSLFKAEILTRILYFSSGVLCCRF